MRKKLSSVRSSGTEKAGDKRKARKKQVETGRQGYTGKVWRRKMKGAEGRVTHLISGMPAVPGKRGLLGHHRMGTKRWQGEGVAQ